MQRWYPIPMSLAFAATLGCFTSELDPDADGVFACSIDADCPDDQVCAGSVCTTPANVVVVNVTSPEPNQVFTAAQFPAPLLAIRLSSTIELTVPGSPVRPGSGFLRLVVDGQVRDLTRGNVGSGLVETFTIEDTPGAHRIALQAFDSTGRLYPNPEATFRTLFWLDDGAPHVAFIDPWPGQTFSTQATTLTPTVHALNFELREPQPVRRDGEGHAHLHYEATFPECVDDPVCDVDYFSLIDTPLSDVGSEQISVARSSRGTLPAVTMTGTDTLSAILRHHDHSVYIHPDDEGGHIVVDTIDIVRVAAP